MLSLPIPLTISLLLAFLLLRRLAERQTHITLLALIAACAVQGVIVSLVQYYGFQALRPVQALMATVIPTIAWFAFAHATGRMPSRRARLLHLAAPLAGLVSVVFLPTLLDVLIPALFIACGVAILLLLARGEDSLPYSRLESGALPLLAWRIIAVSLIASGACDVVIAMVMARGQGTAFAWLPSLVSSLSLLSLGALSLTNAMESRRDAAEEEATVSKDEADLHQSIVAKLDSYVASHKPHRDPDLTLARLARKLGVPAKTLSTAINRTKGENVSRFINRHRIEDAGHMMLQGANVTTAMLDSGFNTKSNFNREFVRIKNKPPRNWLAEQQGTLQKTALMPSSVIQPITERQLL